ncbi:MAG: radical SAM protein [Candidatus Bathyarchaeia archaeon]
MKVILVHPASDPLCHERIFGLKAPPLGLAYIAAYLEKQGYRPSIIDASAQDMSSEELESKLKAADPDIVGIYCSITRVKQSLDVAKIARHLGATVVLGGPHANYDLETLIKNENVDVIVRGEGENVFTRLVELTESGRSLECLNGVAYKEAGKVRINPEAPLIPDLDSLPFPAFHLLPMECYRICGSIPICTLSSSRGCSRKCRYCIVPEMFQGRWRGKTPSIVVDEMEHLSSTYKPSMLLFFDEFFTEDLRRVEAITDEINRRDLHIMWACMSTGIDVSKELMIKMRKAGCLALFFGVECGVITSTPNPAGGGYGDVVRRAFSDAHEAGIFPVANVVFGFPGETWSDYEKLIQWTINLDPDHSLFFKAIPYSDFDDEELKRMETFAYKRFYNRRNYVLKHISRSIMKVSKYRQFPFDFLMKYVKWLIKTITEVNKL